MADYDFYTLFDSLEFQDFARDMVQIREGITFEFFARGTDLGIDGRYVLKDGSVIIFQAKSIRNTSGKILDIAKKERKKLDKLSGMGIRIFRYILVFSDALGVIKKSQIMKLFSPYILDTSDIITGPDLNNYLSNMSEKYHSVEEKYFKLWIQNTKTLKKTLYEVVHSPLIDISKSKLEEAIEKAQIFVETEVYEEAKKKLEYSRTLIISGDPGVGKTTLANQLALYYYAKFGFHSFIYARSVDDLYVSEHIDAKKVIVFDDFWGDTDFNTIGNGKKTRALVSFIEHIQKRKDCILLITTREYILEQGLKKNEEFRKLAETLKLNCRIDQYSREDKLRIYYGHLKYTSLTWEQVNVLSGIGYEVIYSSNYNPRVIEMFLETINPAMLPDRCKEEFLQHLDCPMDFWERIFEELSQEAKAIYLLMAIMPLPVELKVLEKCYYTILKENDKSLEWKGFPEVIIELEKTVIRTDSYNEENSALYVITFQNPSAKDYIQEKIRENQEKYCDFLLDSCSYFSQCIEFLQIMAEVEDKGAWYQRGMSKAILLVDSDSIVFYDRYKNLLQNNREISRFLHTFRTEHKGREQKFGRLQQLFLLYDRRKCSNLKNYFKKTFYAFVHLIDQFPEAVHSEDLEIFSETAVHMIEMEICTDTRWLLNVYMDGLMRNRMELHGGAFETYYSGEWDKYIISNSDKVSAYLEKLYDAEICLAAVKNDAEIFDDWLMECEEAYIHFKLKIPQTFQVKIEKYRYWLTEENKDEYKEETYEENSKEQSKWILSDIKEDFENEYLDGVLPLEVDDLDEWFQLREIPVQIKDIMIAEELADNEYWTSYMWEEEALEFLVGFIGWNGELPLDITEASSAVVKYISDSCTVSEDVLENLFNKLALSGNNTGIFSYEELEQMCPELLRWDDKLIRDMEKIHVLVHKKNWYYLSNCLLALSFHLCNLHELDAETLGKYFSCILLEGKEKVEGQENLQELIRVGKEWLKHKKLKDEFISFLYHMEQNIFLQRVMVPLAADMYNKANADTEEEIVKNIMELLDLEAKYAEDGTCVGGSQSCMKYFWLAQIIYNDIIMDVIPDDLTKEQMKIIEANTDRDVEGWRIDASLLKEAGLLKSFGIYDKLLAIWQNICQLKAEERSDG